MIIGEYIKATDRNTYNKLLKLCDFKTKKPIVLGDSVENLMKHDSYKRVGKKSKAEVIERFRRSIECFFSGRR